MLDIYDGTLEQLAGTIARLAADDHRPLDAGERRLLDDGGR